MTHNWSFYHPTNKMIYCTNIILFSLVSRRHLYLKWLSCIFDPILLEFFVILPSNDKTSLWKCLICQYFNSLLGATLKLLTGPTLFCLFLVLSIKEYNFTANKWGKCTSSNWRWELNSQPLDFESPPFNRWTSDPAFRLSPLQLVSHDAHLPRYHVCILKSLCAYFKIILCEIYISWLKDFVTAGPLLTNLILIHTICWLQRPLQRAEVAANNWKFFYFYSIGLLQSLVAAYLQLFWTRASFTLGCQSAATCNRRLSLQNNRNIPISYDAAAVHCKFATTSD